MCRCGCSPLFPPSEEAALPVNGSTLGTGTFTTYAVIQTGQSLDYALRRKFCSLMSRAYLQILVAMEKFGLWQLKLFNRMIVVATLHAEFTVDLGQLSYISCLFLVHIFCILGSAVT